MFYMGLRKCQLSPSKSVTAYEDLGGINNAPPHTLLIWGVSYIQNFLISLLEHPKQNSEFRKDTPKGQVRAVNVSHRCPVPTREGRGPGRLSAKGQSALVHRVERISEGRGLTHGAERWGGLRCFLSQPRLSGRRRGNFPWEMCVASCDHCRG